MSAAQCRVWNADRGHQVRAGRCRAVQVRAIRSVGRGRYPGRVGLLYVSSADIGTRLCGLLPSDYADFVYAAWLLGVRGSVCDLVSLVGPLCCVQGVLSWL